MTCFNLGGNDFLGRELVKAVSVEKGMLQALWFGLDAPKDAKGVIHGKIVVTMSGVSQSVDVHITVAGAALDDHGDRDSWRLSRLRWLDSMIGLDDDVVTRPYMPIARHDNRLSVLGRELVVSGDGLPQQIRSSSLPVIKHRYEADRERACHAISFCGRNGRGTGQVSAGESFTFHPRTKRRGAVDRHYAGWRILTGGGRSPRI